MVFDFCPIQGGGGHRGSMAPLTVTALDAGLRNAKDRLAGVMGNLIR